MIRSPYFLILPWLLLMVIFSRYVKVTKTKRIFGKERSIVTWWFAILVFAPLIIMTVNRSIVIGDTGAYVGHYKEMPSNFGGIPKYYSGLKKDKGYYILATIIKCLFGSDYKIYFFMIALIQSVSLIKLYRKYSPSYLTAIFLFVASVDYVSWMQNGMRQFTAVSICLLATDWILEKKYIPAVLTVLIASWFHRSALLVIPMIFIAQGKPWNWKTLLFIFFSLMSIMFVDQFTNILDGALEETQYTNIVTDWISAGDDGTNPIRVLIYALPAILSFIGLQYIREENDPVINFATNMSIIAAGLYLISMVTSGIFIGRLPIYASLYSQGILLPWEIDHIFNRGSAKIMKLGMITFYLAFYFYQINIWGLFTL